MDDETKTPVEPQDAPETTNPPVGGEEPAGSAPESPDGNTE